MRQGRFGENDQKEKRLMALPDAGRPGRVLVFGIRFHLGKREEGVTAVVVAC